MIYYIIKPFVLFYQWTILPIIQYLNPIFFQANKQQFFINFLRFTMGCFFECFPISSSFFNTLLYRFQDEHKIYKNNVYIHFLTGIASIIIFIQLRWQQSWITGQIINDFSILFIKTFIITQGIIFNHLWPWFNGSFYKYLSYGLAIINVLLFPLINLHSIKYSLIFWSYNLLFMARYFVMIFNKLIPLKYRFLWTILAMAGLLFISIDFSPLILIFLVSGLKAMAFPYFNSSQEAPLLIMGFFLNNYFANSWINGWDI